MFRINRKRHNDCKADDRLFAPKVSKRARVNSTVLRQNVLSIRSLPSTPTTDEPMTVPSPRATYPSPEWYTDVPTRFQGKRGDLMKVEDLRSTHERAKQAVKDDDDIPGRIERVQKELQFLSCSYFVTKAILKKSNILTDGTLYEIFDPDLYTPFVPYSAAIQSDARQLYEKWFKGDVDGYPMRGIRSHVGKIKLTVRLLTSSYRSYEIEKNYPKTSWKVFGDGHLKNGDWWPLQLAAVRDGAHGDPRAGISGLKAQGVFSVVMNMGTEKDTVDPTKIDDIYNKYPNFDLPDKNQIWYCGTQGKATKAEMKGNPSIGTQLLKLSYEKGNPIRVIRGSKISSKLAPAKGFRYDGLYRIIDSVCICEEFATWIFLLERLPHQEPIRYDGEDKRPHEAELKHWDTWVMRASKHVLE